MRDVKPSGLMGSHLECVYSKTTRLPLSIKYRKGVSVSAVRQGGAESFDPLAQPTNRVGRESQLLDPSMSLTQVR